MKNALKKAWKTLLRYLKSSASFLFGGSKFDPMDAPELDGPDAENDNENENVSDLALERKRKGLEPHDIKEWANAKTLDEQNKIAGRMTAKTAAWCKKLTDDQRAHLAQAEVSSIEAHMNHARMIHGLPMAPKLFGPQPQMINAYRPDLARELVKANRIERDREQGKELDVSLILHDIEKKEQRAANRHLEWKAMKAEKAKAVSSARRARKPMMPPPPHARKFGMR